MIYFIEAVGFDHIKIGSTDGPIEDRLALLQTGNSFRLRVLGTMVGTRRQELELHRKFKPRVRGEWFGPSGRLLDFIRKETAEFATIERIDELFGRKFTEDDFRELPMVHQLFDWPGVVDEIAHRLRLGEEAKEAATACRLDPNECPYIYRGWVKGKTKTGIQGRRLLFERDRKIYRYHARCRTDFPLWLLPKETSKLTEPYPQLRAVFRLVWEQRIAEWADDEKYRLYL